MQNNQTLYEPLFQAESVPVPVVVDSTSPHAVLHDCGELVVVNHQNGRTRHSCAMVLVFESEDEARAVLRAGGCQFAPSKDLDPNVLEEMKRG